MNRLFLEMVAVGLIAIALGVGTAQSERMAALEKKVAALEKHLSAYEDKLNDLSVAFIDHHGDYPRRMRDGRN